MWSVYNCVEEEIFDSEQEKAINMKNSISQYPEDWIDCYEKDLKVGDIVYVEYSPDSQKYIYSYTPQYGSIKEIKLVESISPTTDKKIEEYDIHILNHNGEMVNLNKDNLSIYSRGYTMYIKKFEQQHPKSP
jgi:hypothetical protein